MQFRNHYRHAPAGRRPECDRAGPRAFRRNAAAWWRINEQRVLSQAVIDDLRKGGDREKFKASGMTFRPGYSYHNQWWILHNADGAFEASGVHGQMVHVNPEAEMVVVKLSSHPIPGAGATQALTLKAWSALAKAVQD